MQFQNYHLEDLGSGESEDVPLAFAPRQTLVQRSPSKERMDEWLFLPHVSAQPGDLAAPDLGMSSGNAGLEHRGLLDGVQLFKPASVEQSCNDNGQSSDDCGFRCPRTQEGHEDHDRPHFLADLAGKKCMHFQGQTS